MGVPWRSSTGCQDSVWVSLTRRLGWPGSGLPRGAHTSQSSGWATTASAPFACHASACCRADSWDANGPNTWRWMVSGCANGSWLQPTENAVPCQRSPSAAVSSRVPAAARSNNSVGTPPRNCGRWGAKLTHSSGLSPCSGGAGWVGQCSGTTGLGGSAVAVGAERQPATSSSGSVRPIHGMNEKLGERQVRPVT